MRRLFTAGLAGLFLLSTAGLLGCGPEKKTVVPDKQIELPKEGPSPAGGAPKAGVNAPSNGGQVAPSDQ